ncbi:hypothetical protein LTS17_005363 [Exophiala oligosperma]
MIIGPEAPGSLLVGIAVRLAGTGSTGNDPVRDAQFAGAVTSAAGTVLLVAGLGRLGFLSCILHRPFMRGFVLSLGLGVVVEQTTPALRLPDSTSTLGPQASIAKKVGLITDQLKHLHSLSAMLSITSLIGVLICRWAKVSLKRRWPSVVLIPDRLLIVLLAALLTSACKWSDQGLEVLGELQPIHLDSQSFQWPFQVQNIEPLTKTIGAWFTLAMTGLFESMLIIETLRKTAKKSHAKGFSSDMNQELVALGTANALAGCFQAIPAFGGYGRSKLNVAAGGKTPMSSVFLGLMISCCMGFLLPAFYYVPRCVLAALLFEVGLSMMEECPADVAFFLKMRGWSELLIMILVVCASVFISISSGMMLGLTLSLLSLVRSSTKVKISEGTLDQFFSHSSSIGAPPPTSDDMIMIIEMSERLTFANLRRLEREIITKLEQQGFENEHRKRAQGNILLLKFTQTVTMDNCAAQTLLEIVQDRVEQGVRVLFFCSAASENCSLILEKLSLSGILKQCGGPGSFLSSEEDVMTAIEQVERGEMLGDQGSMIDV